MLIAVIVEFAVGALCLALGLLLWQKQMLCLLHEYHYRHVKQEDLPAYTRMLGIGLCLLGLGIVASGLLMLAESPLWWIPLLAGFVLGLGAMFRAQKRYNGSLMD